MRYIIANWKAHKNQQTALAWTDELLRLLDSDTRIKSSLEEGRIKIIIAPPAPLISILAQKIKNVKGLALAAQDVSEYDSGSHTGEIVAESLQQVAEYVIVGHSEVRAKGEDDKRIAAKIALCKKYGLSPILCLEEGQLLHPDVALVAYEQATAIGSGTATPLDVVLKYKATLSLPDTVPFLYGASVNADNIKDYTGSPEISGFLVGGASLDAGMFFRILQSI